MLGFDSQRRDTRYPEQQGPLTLGKFSYKLPEIPEIKIKKPSTAKAPEPATVTVNVVQPTADVAPTPDTAAPTKPSADTTTTTVSQ